MWGSALRSLDPQPSTLTMEQHICNGRENQGKPFEGKLEFLENIPGSILGWAGTSLRGESITCGPGASEGCTGVLGSAGISLQKLRFLAQLSEKSSTSMWEEALWFCFYLLKEASSSRCILNSFLGLFLNVTSRPANPEP